MTIETNPIESATLDLLDLRGKVALVTGAGQGVGRQIARQLAAFGAEVVVNDFYTERAEAVASEIEADGATALPVDADVTDLSAVSSMVQQAEDAFGRVDILINNAGNAGPEAQTSETKPFWETSPSDWTPWIEVNLYGVLHCARAVLPGMVERRQGRLITLISDAGRVGEPNLVVYSGAKAGAAGFVRGIAKAVGRYNITANSIALGGVRTPTTEQLVENEDLLKQVLRAYTIRRVGEPEDIANMALFLASDAASWITGQTIPVNGGYSSAQ